tara:strand:- start:1371 stop:2054 length:684 start_codon:yes stop_codon:yes gene_type:complete
LKKLGPQIFVLFIFITLIASGTIIYFDIFSIQDFKANFKLIEKEINSHYNYYLLFFLILYYLVATFSLPFAALLSLSVGALFSFFDAIFIISLGSTLGALSSFLIARYALKSFLEKKFYAQLSKINTGIKENGSYYLFFLRMVPVFPFFVINILFGISKMPAIKFFIISFIGMLPGILLYVNAGSQISKINSVSEIYNLSIILSIFIIGIFPMVVKKMLYSLKLIKK